MYVSVYVLIGFLHRDPTRGESGESGGETYGPRPGRRIGLDGSGGRRTGVLERCTHPFLPPILRVCESGACAFHGAHAGAHAHCSLLTG